MRTTLRKIGNAHGVLIPKAMLARTGIDHLVELTIENDAIVLRKPRSAAREGWAEATRALAAAGGDARVWPEFANVDDAEWEW
jgi:antitoxin MazE